MRHFTNYEILDIFLYVIIGANVSFGTLTFFLTLLTFKNKKNHFIWPFFYSSIISFLLASILIPLIYLTDYNFAALIKEEAKKKLKK